MKRKIALILALTMLVSILCSCRRAGEGEESTTMINDAPSTISGTESLDTKATVPPTETMPEERTQGSYTLAECQTGSDPALYVRYPDGSFAKIYNGAVLNWSDYPAKTYGAYYDNSDLIIKSALDDRNPTINSENQLVVFCSLDTDVIYNISPVSAKGCTITRNNEDGKWEAIFLSNSEADNSLYCSKYWRAGSSMKSTSEAGFDCTYINGISVGEYPGIALAEGTDFCDVPAGDTFMLGVVEGTKLVEKEFTADARYYIQADTRDDLKMTPTVDGYAIVDFSDVPAGEYIIHIIWYEGKSRCALSTHITVD